MAGALLLSGTALAGLGWLGLSGSLSPEHIALAIGGTAAAGFAAMALARRGLADGRSASETDLIEAVIERAPTLLVVTDREGRIQRFNRACADLSGYSMQELAERSLWRKLVPAEEQESVARAIDPAAKAPFPRVNENHWVTKSGEKRLLRWTCSDIRDKSGALTAIVAAGIDITDLRRQEALSERSAMALRRAQRIARLAHWSWQPEGSTGPRIEDDKIGHYTYSLEAAEIFEVPVEFLNRADDAAYASLIHPEDRERAMVTYRAFLVSDQAQLSQDYRIRRGNGEFRHIRVISEKLRNAAGDIVEVAGTVQDLTALRRAEFASQQVAAILAAAHKLAGVGYWYWDETGFRPGDPSLPPTRYHYSGEAQSVSGISEVDMRAMSVEDFVWQFVHPNDRQTMLSTLQQFRDGIVDSYSAEYSYFHPTRGERVLRSIAVRERDQAGRALHATGLIQDITDIRRGQLALRDTERQLEAAHRLARLGYWSWLKERDGEAIRSAIWSKEAAAITGIDSATAEAAIVDGSFEQVFPHPDDRLRLMRAVTELRDGKRSAYDLDYRLRRPDGREIWLRSLAEVLKDEAGRVIGAFGVLQDISERKEAEADLRRAHMSLANAQRIAHVGNWSRVMASDDFTSSDEVYRIFGLDNAGARLTFKSMLSLVHPADRDRFAAEIERTIQTPAPFLIEHRIILPDGKTKTVRQQGEPMLDSDGRLVRLEGIVLDITDIKAREEALNNARIRAELADRAKTEFLANMSHELRTPLNAVIGFSDVLSQQILGPVPAVYGESVEAIRTSAHHLLEIISDLLEMSRIESGERYLQEFPFDVRAAIHECGRHFAAQAQRDGIFFTVDDTGRLPTLIGEERAFKQVLNNLLSNALKFTPRNGRVTITATNDTEAGLLIAVSDTGKGIDPKLLPKLGRPFEQGETTMSRRYGGVGLGLAISRRLMALHDGKLEITSAPGAGTRVIMVFPPERVLSENTR